DPGPCQIIRKAAGIIALDGAETKCVADGNLARQATLSGEASDVPEAFRALLTAFMQVDIYSLCMLCSEIKDDLKMGIPVKINALRIEPTNEVSARLQCGIEKVENLGPPENPALRECNDLDLDLSAPCVPQVQDSFEVR